MTISNIFSFIFIVYGIFSITASIANWNWFFDHRKARIFLKIFGRNGSRIFYAALGLFIFSAGFFELIA